MLSAAVLAAGVMAAAVFVLVMSAMDVRIEGQLTGCKRCRSFVCAARNTAVQSNARLRKRSLCAAADAAADQRVDLMRGQEACRAPWPLPFVSTTSLCLISPFSTSYSLNCSVWPKC